MFKVIHPHVWVFDAEWVPDPVTGRAVYGLGEDRSDEEVVAVMYQRGGATEEEPRPYLKTILCRVVSISAVTRHDDNGQVRLQLTSLPAPAKELMQPLPEADLLARFLEGVGRTKPQLVGYNSVDADLRVLVQRAVAQGVQAPGFAQRPDKPWAGVDYFVTSADWHVDLQEALAGRGRGRPSLHELAVASGIPGKLDVAGTDVQDLWSRGEIDRIVAYNEFDALTTYLLWLRVAFFAGFFTEPQYTREQEQVRDLIRREAQRPERSHLNGYLSAWSEMSSSIRAGEGQMGLGI